MSEDFWFTKTLAGARKLFHEVQAEKSQDFIFQPMSMAQGGIEQRPLVLDEEYFTIKIRSSRIVDIRRWKDKFHACLHARTTYLHESAGNVEFQTMLAPNDMMNLDPGDVDRVVVLDLAVLKPVPFRGKFGLELGLFSIKGEDLAAPYIALLSGLAEAAGGSFKQALSFSEPLRKGFDLLFGTSKQSTLEIGVQTEWSEPKTGTWLLMRAPANAVPINSLKIDDSGRLTLDGNAFRNFPYVILQIEPRPRYEEWMTVPELKTAYNAIGDAHRANDVEKTTKMVEQFYTTLQWSPDLIPADVALLYSKALNKLKPPGRLGGASGRTTAKAKRAGAVKIGDPGTFEGLNLYGSPEL